MTKILTGSQLYEFILQKSQAAREFFWVCSPQIGFRAHELFAQDMLKNPPADTRFIFKLNDDAAKKRETNPYEIQYFLEHYKNCKINSNRNFNTNIHIFDDSALITSANLTKESFERSFEVGVALEGPEVNEAKRLFEALWETGKPIGELKKLKQAWYLHQEEEKVDSKKIKSHTIVRDWINDCTNTWLIATSLRLPDRIERKIKKEAYWINNLSIIGDVGYQAFKELKLGDFGFIVDLKSNRGDIISIEKARFFDKSRIETDLGDYHVAYVAEQKHLINRASLFRLLAKIGKSPKNCELMLSQEQLDQITNVLSTVKIKKKRKAKCKNKK